MTKYILPTFAGIEFDLQNPTIEMIDIKDAAHHLSIENRFNGATIFPYSVAYHSILACDQAPEDIKLETLLHDLGETWYKDWPSPLKKLVKQTFNIKPKETIFDIMEERIDTLVAYAFNLSLDTNVWKRVKEIDLRMATTEILQLCPKFRKEAWAHDFNSYKPYTNISIMELNWRNVEKLFLERYEKYKRI